MFSLLYSNNLIILYKWNKQVWKKVDSIRQLKKLPVDIMLQVKDAITPSQFNPKLNTEAIKIEGRQITILAVSTNLLEKLETHIQLEKQNKNENFDFLFVLIAPST